MFGCQALVEDLLGFWSGIAMITRADHVLLWRSIFGAVVTLLYI
jgi:hypothetical protein